MSIVLVPHSRFSIVIYDFLLFLLAEFCNCFLPVILFEKLSFDYVKSFLIEAVISVVLIAFFRILFRVYLQIWRYGNVQSYLRIIISDGIATVINLLIVALFPIQYIFFKDIIAVNSSFVLLCISMRMFYKIAYKYSKYDGKFGALARSLLKIFRVNDIAPDDVVEQKEINIAIIGAGEDGIRLAEDLEDQKNSVGEVKCFIDKNPDKIGRRIGKIPVISDKSVDDLKDKYKIDEVVLANKKLTVPDAMELYTYYKQYGYNMKVFDDSEIIRQVGNSKKKLREFDIEDLLFRQSVYTVDDKTKDFYKNKTVLITGGGGSIGSELCRQIAGFATKQIIIVDIYENGAYDVQQELKQKYGNAVNLSVEIISVCDRIALDSVFDTYRPDIVIHAAAHKHVPLMEHNCCEAVKNNVFGTLNTVELSEKYGAARFMMVSTDKAVNPTNVMGATKRMCEMIVQCMSTKHSKTVFTATRFGNVLGSAGSVIPLFKRQIASGGPITLTDKRIIRYFMTIPEASQLVLTSGAMAKNGELFVLDMGKPVKILTLAENMIRLSGFEPYKDIDIAEIGLRPGEKLYEELLVKTEELDKTDNSMIFIERDRAISSEELEYKLSVLRDAVKNADNNTVKQALYKVVPTYKSPEIVNSNAKKVEEFRLAGVS